jgi:3-phenylpropionate/trans-cinnamate dioxygenase ferredoxin subunit
MAFVKVGEANSVPVGQVRIVEVDDEEIALCNVDGQIYAVANVCTHDEGPLGEGYLMGDEIECPRHGARFCVRNGEVRNLPAIVPIPTLDVKIEDGAVWVESDS